MPKTSLANRHDAALVATAETTALAAAVDAEGGAHALLVEVLQRLRECITQPQGRNGPATAVAAARLMVDVISRSLGGQTTGQNEGAGAPLVALTLVQAPPSPTTVRGEVIDADPLSP